MITEILLKVALNTITPYLELSQKNCTTINNHIGLISAYKIYIIFLEVVYINIQFYFCCFIFSINLFLCLNVMYQHKKIQPFTWT
jgi:hypothetical protein